MRFIQAIHALLDRLASLQFRRAGAFVVAALLLAAAAVPLVRQLGLNSAWDALLPRDKPSVQDIARIEGRVAGLNTLTLAIESEDLEAMQGFARELVPRLEDLPRELVRSVDWNVGTYETFVEENKHLFASVDDLREIRSALEERVMFEHNRRNPFFVCLEDDCTTPPPGPDEVMARMRARAEEGRARLSRFPGGFYVHPDGNLLVIFVRSDLKGGNARGIRTLRESVEAIAADIDPSRFAPDLRLTFAGDLVVAREEHDAIKDELVLATTLTIVLVLSAIFVFFRKARSIPLLGFALMVPVVITFGFAELAVDYLNTSTAFLGSIVIGNGINPNIIWLARYFEERRAGRSVEQAMQQTHRGVWLATAAASLAAAVAYGSLIITDFRGFRDFGIIGFAGMVLCWFGAMLVLPAATALSERMRPLKLAEEGVRASVFGRAFAAMVERAPRAALALSAVLGVGASVVMYQYLAGDPLEYDFRNLKSLREGSTTAQRINARIGDFLSSSDKGQGIVLVVDDVADALPLRDELERLRDEDHAPWSRVRVIQDLLPSDQEAKLPLLAEIRELLEEMRPYADAEQLAQLDEHTPPEDLHALTLADLPEDVARPFTERDGTRGRLIVVEKQRGESVWDGRYLMAWAAALREVRLADGTRPPLAGRAPVFADMIQVISDDGPRTIVVSFLATLVLVILTFRRLRERALTMMALLLGIVWMAASMALAGMKLNFLNFVAFPITFGNGVDYGVNVMRRYSLECELDTPNPVRAAVEETGGAVVLCSLTTIVGYSTLYTSANQALNSFGAAMAISEVTCLISAVITMPALLIVLRKRDAARAQGTLPPG
ncbi:MAG: MMPL family transporter [Sandaracinaceae bacterium]|nr:MMPL family transporter [Myxococcales bacterium]MCB9661493.1 MMPL family transporter [Sandaracinaceae bacterium]